MRQLNLFENDMRNTWKTINSALNKSKQKSHITKIKSDNIFIEDPQTLANEFNFYFSHIGQNLARNIPHTDSKFYDFLGMPNPNSIFFSPVTDFEI